MIPIECDQIGKDNLEADFHKLLGVIEQITSGMDARSNNS
jgi:hypothetical protein